MVVSGSSLVVFSGKTTVLKGCFLVLFDDLYDFPMIFLGFSVVLYDFLSILLWFSSENGPFKPFFSGSPTQLREARTRHERAPFYEHTGGRGEFLDGLVFLALFVLGFGLRAVFWGFQMLGGFLVFGKMETSLIWPFGSFQTDQVSFFWMTKPSHCSPLKQRHLIGVL